MNYKNSPRIDINLLKEMYDDEQLEMMEEDDERSLVRDLVEYSNELIEHILELRNQVNQYDHKLSCERKDDMAHYQAPFADLHSDIYIDFSEHQVYDKFKDELDKMLN